MFENCYAIVMTQEGGYSNNKNDKGGETYCGISRRFHPDWKGWAIIDELIKNNHTTISSPKLDILKKEFYYDTYWKKLNLELIDNLALASTIFSIAINSGISHSVKYFQRALNFLGAELEVDGVLGQDTINAYKKNNIKRKQLLAHIVNAMQLTFCVIVTEKDTSQKMFSVGWANRYSMCSK